MSDHLQEAAAKGGKARAEKLTPEERSKIAKTAASARWNRDIPLADYEGNIPFGELIIPCAVLSDGTRVLSERGVTKGFGLKRAGSNWQKHETGARLPVFASADNLKPFMDKELRLALLEPVPYRPKSSPGAVAHGIRAELIPQICDVWLQARDAGALKKQQEHVATQVDIVMRGLATTGIIALVDEATGYQTDRSRDALAKIFEEFISKELSRWAKRFPDEFYAELARLRGVTLSAIENRPQYFGHLTNDIVYNRLAPGVRRELQKIVPKDKKGRRKYHFHRRLTTEIGHPRLQEHLHAVIVLMRAYDDWDTFKERLDRSLPVQDEQKRLPYMG